MRLFPIYLFVSVHMYVCERQIHKYTQIHMRTTHTHKGGKAELKKGLSERKLT